MSLTKTDISDPLSTPGILIGAESSEPETHFKLKFCTGFYFTLHSGYLKDKLTWSHPGNLSLYDISYKIGFLEVPILLKFLIPLNSSINCQINIGPSLALSIIDESRHIYKNLIDNSYASGISDVVPKHDYTFDEDPAPASLEKLGNSCIALNVGICINYNMFIFEIRYSSHSLRTTRYLSMNNERLHTIHLITGLKL